jgi:hypothetical protein
MLANYSVVESHGAQQRKIACPWWEKLLRVFMPVLGMVHAALPARHGVLSF